MIFADALLKKHSSYSALIETIVLTVISIILCFLVNSKNILFLNGDFPFSLIVPILTSLLYGLAYGVVSYVIILLTSIVLNVEMVVSLSFAIYLFSSAVLIVICGQFGTYWRDRLSHVEQLNKYLRERIDQISRAYYFVKISHDAIEEQFISMPVSLRSVFIDLRKMFENSKGKFSKDIMQRFLELISHYAQINKAQIHLANDKGQIEENAFVAIGGDPVKEIKKDLLVKTVVKNHQLYYVDISDFDEKLKSNFVVAAPIVSSNDKVYGYLLIENIAFRALNKDALEKLMVFLAYFANVKEAYDISNTITKKYPDCPVDFAKEVVLLNELRKKYHVMSCFVTISIPKNKQAEFFVGTLSHLKRNLDLVWVHEKEKKLLFITFMPLAKLSAVHGYVARIKAYFLDHYEENMIENGLRFYYLNMPKSDAQNVIEQLVKITSLEVSEYE